MTHLSSRSRGTRGGPCQEGTGWRHGSSGPVSSGGGGGGGGGDGGGGGGGGDGGDGDGGDFFSPLVSCPDTEEHYKKYQDQRNHPNPDPYKVEKVDVFLDRLEALHSDGRLTTRDLRGPYSPTSRVTDRTFHEKLGKKKKESLPNKINKIRYLSLYLRVSPLPL